MGQYPNKSMHNIHKNETAILKNNFLIILLAKIINKTEPTENVAKIYPIPK